MSDTVTINSGTKVMAGKHLPDVILGRTIDPVTHATIAPTLDLVGRADIGNVTVDTVTTDGVGATINVRGHDTIGELDLRGSGFPPGEATINIKANSSLTETMQGLPRSMIHVNGGAGATLDNEGASTVSIATIAANVTGSGSWTDGYGRLEFVDGVGSGQTVAIGAAELDIDQPSQFHGLLSLQEGWGGNGVYLHGLHGDAFSYDPNGLLTITAAGVTVGQLRVAEGAGAAFSVSDYGSGIRLGTTAGPQQLSGSIQHVA
jgi:hypothetical protein